MYEIKNFHGILDKSCCWLGLVLVVQVAQWTDHPFQYGQHTKTDGGRALTGVWILSLYLSTLMSILMDHHNTRQPVDNLMKSRNHSLMDHGWPSELKMDIPSNFGITYEGGIDNVSSIFDAVDRISRSSNTRAIWAQESCSTHSYIDREQLYAHAQRRILCGRWSFPRARRKWADTDRREGLSMNARRMLWFSG